MPQTPHTERHFTAGDSVRDVIGMSDGLTVPFALAAGLSGAVSVIVTLVALALSGWVKEHFTGTPPFHSAVQTMVVGGTAAAAAFAIARAIS